MICDFKNVTDTLMRNMGTGTTIYYINLLNTLFGAYLLYAKIYSFDNPTAAKLHKGTIRVSPEMSGFYLNSDMEIMKKDVGQLIEYIFDKPNGYKELYDLIKYDDLLSILLRKNVLEQLSEQYTDDNSLIDIIAEAVYIAVTRQYKKVGRIYSAVSYANNFSVDGSDCSNDSQCRCYKCRNFSP